MQSTAGLDMHVDSQNVSSKNPSLYFIMWSVSYCLTTYVIPTCSEQSWPKMKRNVAQNVTQLFYCIREQLDIFDCKWRNLLIMECFY